MKYELVHAALNSTGERTELPPQMRGVQGVLLAQVLDGRKLKIEFFPAKKATDVRAFTGAAKTYER